MLGMQLQMYLVRAVLTGHCLRRRRRLYHRLGNIPAPLRIQITLAILSQFGWAELELLIATVSQLHVSAADFVRCCFQSALLFVALVIRSDLSRYDDFHAIFINKLRILTFYVFKHLGIHAAIQIVTAAARALLTRLHLYYAHRLRSRHGLVPAHAIGLQKIRFARNGLVLWTVR